MKIGNTFVAICLEDPLAIKCVSKSSAAESSGYGTVVNSLRLGIFFLCGDSSESR